eukprot:scaffold754_cov248-Pinguiococcus_pyrenoidosus.AAC.46
MCFLSLRTGPVAHHRRQATEATGQRAPTLGADLGEPAEPQPELTDGGEGARQSAGFGARLCLFRLRLPRGRVQEFCMSAPRLL